MTTLISQSLGKIGQKENMELKITKQKPLFSKVGHDKRCVIVEFPNCEFKWMPTYMQLRDISKAIHEIEIESWEVKQ